MKKTIKILTTSLILIMTLCLVTGCDLFKTTQNKNTKEVTQKESKGKCDVLECIKKLDTKNTLEDVNKVIGFEGEKKQEGNGWSSYIWELNDDDSVEATFFSTSTTIKINFKDERIKNNKVDFSSFEELKKALSDKKEVDYKEVKEKFGGVEGTLIEKSSSSNKYKWVNSKGGYLDASFGNTTGKCTMIMGRI